MVSPAGVDARAMLMEGTNSFEIKNQVASDKLVVTSGGFQGANPTELASIARNSATRGSVAT